MKEASPIEEFIFEFIDKFKPLFYPGQWNSTFLDYSKNEIFALLFVYRKGTVSMSEIAEYIGVPLNTATGIIGRLEKKGVINRQRDTIDKRVVTVNITSDGMEFLKNELNIISYYYNKLMDSISEEEKILLLKLISNFLEVMTQELPSKVNSDKQNMKARKITIE